jgi:hypothetical protein
MSSPTMKPKALEHPFIHHRQHRRSSSTAPSSSSSPQRRPRAPPRQRRPQAPSRQRGGVGLHLRLALDGLEDGAHDASAPVAAELHPVADPELAPSPAATSSPQALPPRIPPPRARPAPGRPGSRRHELAPGPATHELVGSRRPPPPSLPPSTTPSPPPSSTPVGAAELHPVADPELHGCVASAPFSPPDQQNHFAPRLRRLGGEPMFSSPLSSIRKMDLALGCLLEAIGSRYRGTRQPIFEFASYCWR